MRSSDQTRSATADWLAATLGRFLTRENMLVAVMLIALFLASILPFWGEWAVDFSAYYYAGHFYQTGQLDMIYTGPPDIIGPEMPDAWQAALAMDGHADEISYPFIYLPWVAAVMAPITKVVEPMTGMNAMLVLNAALLVFSILMAWRVIGRGRVSLMGWSVASVLLLVSSATSVLPLHLGQIQILVFAAVLLSFERLQSGHPVQAALALALAACLKITPAAFAIIFLWNRSWTALFTFIACCLAFAGVNIWLIGWPLHATYFELMAALNAQVFLSNIGVSMEGLVYQVAAFLNGDGLVFDANEYSFAKPVWQDLVVKLGFVAGLVSCWLVTRRLERTERIAFQGLILAVLVPLMTPLGWVHYYLLASLMLPVFVRRGSLIGQMIFVVHLLCLNLVVFILSALPSWPFMPQMAVGVPIMVAVLIWAHVLAWTSPTRPSNAPG